MIPSNFKSVGGEVKRTLVHRVVSGALAALLLCLPRSAWASSFSNDNEAWVQRFSAEYLLWLFAILAGMFVVISIVHFAAIGPKRFSEEGEPIRFFSLLTRLVHLGGILSCTTLIVTGVMIIYGGTVGVREALAGDPLLREVRLLHLHCAVLFGISVIIMFFIWVPQMLPHKRDLNWIASCGGYLSKEKKPIPAHKFNAGQKLWFWLVTLGGMFMCFSGWAMYHLWGDMHFLNAMALVHNVVAILIVAMYLVHVYLTLWGIKGAWRSMITGNKSEEEVAILHNDYYRELRSSK